VIGSNEAALAGRLFAACCAIACVLAGFRFLAQAALRRGHLGPRARSIALIETLYLPNSASLHLVRTDDRLVLVGRSASSIASICELPLPARDRARAPAPGRSPPLSQELAAGGAATEPAAGGGAG
jgi:flagellar biogenesis protein FliO